jgi:hypothetical protein
MLAMVRRSNPHHVFGGTRDLMPHPLDEEPKHIVGLRAGKALQWKCRILGFDVYIVDGSKVAAQWADFIGGHHLAYRFIPKRDIWLDDRFKEWQGFVASHEILEALLMNVRKWGYEPAHKAANALEQQLRAASELGRLKENLRDLWYHHLAINFPGLDRDHLDEMARQAARQLWKYL